MVLSRLTKVNGPGISTDTNLVANNADFSGITTSATSFNIGVTTIHSTLIESHNIVSTGVITATSFSGDGSALTGVANTDFVVGTAITMGTANFTGNVTIGGTLTYEDVTNIDSVGIITAQKDIHVGAGVSAVGVGTFGSLDIGGDIDVDGHTNLDNVSIAGVTTTSDNIIIPDDKKLILGTQSGRQLEIFHNTSGSSNHRIQSTSSTNHLNIIANTIRPSANTFAFTNNAGNKSVFRINADTTTTLYYNGNTKLTTENTGVNITGIVTATSADINGDLDVDGHTNLDNVSIAGVTTISQDLDVDGHTNLDNISVAGVSTFTGVNNFNLDLVGNSNNNAIVFRRPTGGNNNQYGFRINHHTGTGNQVGGDTYLAIDKVDKSAGTPTAAIAAFSDDGLHLLDSMKIHIGGPNSGQAAGDLQIYNKSSVSYLRIDDGNPLLISKGEGSENIAKFIPDGAVELYHNNIKRLETSSVGVSIPQDLDVDGHTNLDNVTIAGVTTSQNNSFTAISKTASSDAYTDLFVYDTRKDSDGGAWRHRTTNTSWYNETLNTSIRGSRRDFPQVAIVAVGNNYIHIFDADDPDMSMWMKFPAPSGSNRNVMYGSGNPRCVHMLNGILCTGSQATNYWPIVIDFIRDDIIGLYSSTGHIHYSGTQGNISLRNAATSDSGKWWPGTVNGGSGTSGNNSGQVARRWWFGDLIVNQHVTSVVMSVRPEAPIDKTTGMQIPTIYLGTRGGMSIIHSNVGDTGTSYNSGVYDITSNGGSQYSGVGDITITEDGFLWALHDYYNYNSDGGYNLYRDSSAVDLKRLDNQMNDLTHSPSADSYSSLNNQAGGNAQKGREYYWPSTGAENGTHKIGTGNTWAASIVERDAWGSPSGLAFVKRSIYYYDHKENSSFLPRSHQNRGLVAMITKDYNTGWHMTGNEISSAYIADGLTSNIPAGASEMLDRGHQGRHLDVVGGLTRQKCATGSDLSGVSGFSANNYVRIINASINAGNPIDITLMGWIKVTNISGYSYLCSISNGSDGMGIAVHNNNSSSGGKPYFYDTQHGSIVGDKGVNDGEWHHVCGVFSCSSNRKILYVDGQRQTNVIAPSNRDYSDLDTIAVGHWCGNDGTSVQHTCLGHLALVKLGLTDLTDQQIKRIYEDEKKLLLPNAKAFLYGSSNEVKAIGYDEKKEIYHVGTSSGRSDFSGLSRINNTTTAVTTAISAYDGLIAEQ